MNNCDFSCQLLTGRVQGFLETVYRYLLLLYSTFGIFLSLPFASPCPLCGVGFQSCEAICFSLERIVVTEWSEWLLKNICAYCWLFWQKCFLDLFKQTCTLLPNSFFVYSNAQQWQQYKYRLCSVFNNHRINLVFLTYGNQTHSTHIYQNRCLATNPSSVKYSRPDNLCALEHVFTWSLSETPLHVVAEKELVVTLVARELAASTSCVRRHVTFVGGEESCDYVRLEQSVRRY